MMSDGGNGDVSADDGSCRVTTENIHTVSESDGKVTIHSGSKKSEVVRSALEGAVR